MTSDFTSPLAGFHDLLPPTAHHEAVLAHTIMSHFHSAGYERVKPPLVEQEQHDSLPLSAQVHQLRFAHTPTEKIAAVRHDITPQVMRIARTKLSHQERPLRLAYCGECLSTQQSQLHPDKQYLQAGIELFGANSIQAELDVILTALDALKLVSSCPITIDLNLPTLTQSLIEHHHLSDKDTMILRSILNRKDISSLQDYDTHMAKTLTQLLQGSGPMDESFAALQAISLPQAVQEQRDLLLELAHQIRQKIPNLLITLDPLENRGMVAYSGITFSLFMEGHDSDIGRGGRYETHSPHTPQRLFARHHESHHNHLYPHHSSHRAPLPSPSDEFTGEQAVGMTLFIDALAHTIAHPESEKRILAVWNSEQKHIQQWRADNAIVIQALEDYSRDALHRHARALRCSHILAKGSITPIDS